MFLPSHEEQTINDLSRGYTLKVERLAVRNDGGQHFMYICRGQDKDRIGRRFLQRLEQGITGFRGKHVRFVKYIDLILTCGGRHHYLLAQVTNTVDTTIGGGVNLDDIERVAGGDLTALLAFVARLAILRVATVDRLSTQAGSTGFSGASRHGKEVGMYYARAPQGVFGWASNPLVAGRIIGVRGAPVAGERE